MNLSIDKWIEGMIPGECSIMGIPMKELTFGHMVLMERMLCFPIKAEDDMAHSILICSKNYKEAHDYINYWRTKYISVFNELMEHILNAPEKWGEKCYEYFSYHIKSMQIMNKQGEGKPAKQIGSPFLAIVRVVAITKLGYNPLTLNDAPFAPIILDMQTKAELDGRISISGGSAVADAIEMLKQRTKNDTK